MGSKTEIIFIGVVFSSPPAARSSPLTPKVGQYSPISSVNVH